MFQICFRVNHSQSRVFKISKNIQNFDQKYISGHVVPCKQNCHPNSDSTHCAAAVVAGSRSRNLATLYSPDSLPLQGGRQMMIESLLGRPPKSTSNGRGEKGRLVIVLQINKQMIRNKQTFQTFLRTNQILALTLKRKSCKFCTIGKKGQIISK